MKCTWSKLYCMPFDFIVNWALFWVKLINLKSCWCQNKIYIVWLNWLICWKHPNSHDMDQELYKRKENFKCYLNFFKGRYPRVRLGPKVCRLFWFKQFVFLKHLLSKSSKLQKYLIIQTLVEKPFSLQFWES